VGACGNVLSCQALNATISHDPGANNAYPVLKRLGVRACPGLGGEVERADKWQDPGHPRLL
jgi:hypothetical protein